MEDQGSVQAGQSRGNGARPSPKQPQPAPAPAPAAVDQGGKASAPGKSSGAAPAPQAAAGTGRRRQLYKDFVFKPRSSHAVWKRPITLQSHTAQKVYEGCWQSIQETFFYLDVILGWQGDLADEALASLFEVLETRFDQYEKELDAETKRLKKVSEAIGSRTSVNYENVDKLQLQVYSPSAGRYAELIEKLDEMVSWLDSLWFAGRVKPKDRITTCRQWTLKMRRFNREAYQIKVRAAACVQRRDDVRRSSPAQDLEVQKAKQRATAAAAAALRQGGKTAKSAKAGKAQAEAVASAAA
jgi:hypothetical protein